MQRIAQQRKRSVERIRGYMVKLATFPRYICKSSLLELPIEMVATVFEHMTQRNVFIWILKVFEYAMSDRHIQNVSETVEI